MTARDHACSPGCVVCADTLIMGRAEPARGNDQFPSLNLMKRGEPLIQAGGSCYCDGTCKAGGRCAAWPQGRHPVERPSFPTLASYTLAEPAREWPPGVPAPRIKRIGTSPELYRCRVTFRGQTFEGFGNTALRAWNACSGRLNPFKP